MENSRKIKVYLCSRVAKDAHENNERVAKALEALDYEVFVPHREEHNQPDENGNFDKQKIYSADTSAMLRANAVVVVGRVGKDCSWELGWFCAAGIPVIFVPFGDSTWQDSPMLPPTLQNRSSHMVLDPYENDFDFELLEQIKKDLYHEGIETL